MSRAVLEKKWEEVQGAEGPVRDCGVDRGPEWEYPRGRRVLSRGRNMD
jgi:hypothetical protein